LISRMYYAIVRSDSPRNEQR